MVRPPQWFCSIGRPAHRALGTMNQTRRCKRVRDRRANGMEERSRAAGRPARPLFATPGIAAEPAPRRADYTLVIRSGSEARPTGCSAYTRRHGTRPRPQRDRPAARGRPREAGRRARPQGEGRGRRVERRDLPTVSGSRWRRHPSSGSDTSSTCRSARTRRSRGGRCSRATAGGASTAGPPPRTSITCCPRSRGGLHVWENVVAACRRCNAKKMDRTPARGRLPPASPTLRPVRRLPPHPRPGRARLGAVPDLNLGCLTGSQPVLHPRPAHRSALSMRDTRRTFGVRISHRARTAVRAQLLLTEVECEWDKRGPKWRKGEDAWPNSSARIATNSTRRGVCPCRPGSVRRSPTGPG